MKKKLLLLIAILLSISSFSRAALQIELGQAVKTGSFYVFPELTVTGSAGDKAYVIRFMFNRATVAADAITLPTLPGGWTQNAKSTQYIRMIDIPAGAVASDLQTYLRTVEATYDSGKIGQGVTVLLSENSSDTGRLVYYSSDNGHWYEYVQESKLPPSGGHPYGTPYEWWEAYNRALDRTFMGLTGYLAVITSAQENDFIFSVSSGKTGWVGGARGDIRPVTLPDGKLSGRPSYGTITCNDQSQYLDYFYWACGPEWVAAGKDPANAIFYNKKTYNGTAVGVITYNYHNFSSTEPSNTVNASSCFENSAQGENFLHLGWNGQKTWNDYGIFGYDPDGPTHSNTITGSIIEFQGTLTGANSSSVVGFESTKTATLNSVQNNGTSSTPVTILFNEIITYNITAMNASENNTSVVVRDTVPTGLEVVSGTITAGGTFDPTFRVITWNLTIPVLTTSSVTYRAKPISGDTNLLENKAYVISGGTISKRTNSTFHRATLCTATFTAGANGTLSNNTAQQVDYGRQAKSGVLTHPSPGYQFTGWSYPAYTNMKGGSQPAGNGIMNYTNINFWNNLTLTANFGIATYNITYNLAGGTVGSNPATYNFTTATFTLNNPTRTGYTFAGWIGSNGATPQTSVSIPVGSTGNKNYTAHWTPIPYSITYNYSGGTASVPPNPSTYNIESANFTLNNPTRDGYTFAGWTGSNGVVAQTAVTVATGTTGNLTYTANWTPINYTLSYNFNSGTAPVIANPTSYDITQTPLSFNNQPTRVGYTFIGWTGDNGSTPQITVTLPAGTFGNQSYTANWSTDAYTISYNYMGGSAPSTANPASYDITDTPFGISNQPTRTGYTFTGWTGSNGIIPETTVNIISGTMGNLNYSANWAPITYNITYDYDGGTAPVVANPATYDITQTPITFNNEPTRSGYTFIGWTGDNGSTPQITVQIPINETGNLTYTANWALNTYNITYDYNLGVGPILVNPISYDITQTPFNIIYQPTRNGYSFTGWTGSNGVAPETIVTVAGGTSGDLSYQAQWAFQTYTITYNLNGGIAPVVVNPPTYNITQLPLTIPNEPTHSGLVFIGWTGSNGTVAEKTVIVNDTTLGNLTFDAVWSFQFPNDTVYSCGDPILLESGGDALSYEWILPDGVMDTTANILAKVSGPYILRSNYGSMVVADTVYAMLFFNDQVRIKRETTGDAKIGRTETFTVNINPLIKNATYQWNFIGGTSSSANTDTAHVIFKTTGKKIISVEVGASSGSLTCSKRIEYTIFIDDVGRGFFVDQNVKGGLQNGSSWDNAYRTIDDALTRAIAGDYIWVAKGVYSPPSGSSYVMKTDSIRIYGSFEGVESYLSERRIDTYPTILKGKGQSVIKNSNISSAGCWDGFTIEGGNATQGGGIHNHQSTVTIANCVIRSNQADEGAGVYNVSSSPLMYNVEISGNTSPKGGAVFNLNSNPQLVNVTIAGNKAGTAAAMYNEDSNPQIENTIIWDNRSDDATPIINKKSAPNYYYSLIQGSKADAGNWDSSIGNDLGYNLDANPMFRKNGFDNEGNIQSGRYELSVHSPAVDKGRNTLIYGIRVLGDIHLKNLNSVRYLSGYQGDIRGFERIADEKVDLGAYESNSESLGGGSLSIKRELILPSIDGLTMDPAPGTHIVKGGDDFMFTIYPQINISLVDLKVSTGMDYYDKDRIILTKNQDSSVTVIVKQIKHAITLKIVGISPLSKEGLETSKVWSHGNKVYVNTDEQASLQVYTMKGQLYTILTMEEGENSFELGKGIYLVRFRGHSHKVIIQ